MVSKPFSIQSPEQIAKDYGGNKQKIVQAMQQGIVDPTAGVLAGMFIDRMRSAAQSEQGPQQTVAQQVMSPQPQMPPMQGGGLGALPPQGGAPVPNVQAEAQQMGAPMPQMAEGGIIGLDIPDGMYDEPSNGGFNDGYAGGGIVAFADGGPLGPWFEETATKAIPGIGVTSRQRSAAHNAQVGGVKNSYHLTNNARDFVPPKGMTMAQLQNQLHQTFGTGYDIINEGDHVHVEPGPGRNKGAAPAIPQPHKADVNTPQGRAMSLSDSIAAGNSLLSGLPHQASDMARDQALADLDPATQEKQRKQDMWMALANMGFSMASTQSPSLLQSIGQAAMATLPGVEASKKERKAAKDEAIRTLMQLEDTDRATATKGVELGMNIYKTGLDQEQAEAALNQRRSEQSQQYKLGMAEIASRERTARIAAQSRDSTFDQALKNRTAQITQRLQQRLPVFDPDTGRQVNFGPNTTAAEIAVLAQRWATKDIAKPNPYAGMSLDSFRTASDSVQPGQAPAPQAPAPPQNPYQGFTAQPF